MDDDVTIMVNLNHPCYGIDVQRDVSEYDAQMMERQGYIRLEELRKHKARERGRFDNFVILEAVEE